MPRTVPTMQNYQTQNANSVGVQKPCSGKGREKGPTCTHRTHTTWRGREETHSRRTLELGCFSTTRFYHTRPLNVVSLSADCSPEAEDPPSDVWSEGQSGLMLHHGPTSLPLASSHHVGLMSTDIIMRRRIRTGQ